MRCTVVLFTIAALLQASGGLAETIPPATAKGLPLSYYYDRGLIPSPQDNTRITRAPTLWTPTSSTIVATEPTTYTVDCLSMTRVKNDSIIIRNTGTANLVNPWVVANKKRNWYSNAAILEEALGGETNPELRAFSIWHFMRQTRYHWYPAEATSECHVPVKYLNVYGYGLCDDSAFNLEVLWRLAGFSNARSYDINGHVISEVYYSGGYHILDADLEYFFPGNDKKTLLSVDECEDNGQLVTRIAGASIASLYTTTSNNYKTSVVPITTHTMEMMLRPGESLERCFYNWGKYHDNLYHELPPSFGNGHLLYAPDLATSISENGVYSITGLTREDSPAAGLKLAPAESTGEAVWKMSSPYVFVGGTVTMQVSIPNGSKSIRIQASKNGSLWTTLGTQSGGYTGTRSFPLDSFIAPNTAGACYSFYVRATITATNYDPDIVLQGISIDGEIQCSPRALPTLELSTLNEISATFDDQPGAEMEVTFNFGYDDLATAVAAPASPVFPADASTTASEPLLRWIPCVSYNVPTWQEVIVSYDPKGLHHVTPMHYLRQTGTGAQWQPPAGWLIPGETYYWKVKELYSVSPWSGTWSFTYDPNSSVDDWRRY